MGALAGWAGALCAHLPTRCPHVAGVLTVWLVGLAALYAAARRWVAPLWHGPLAALALLSGVGLLVQTRLHPALGWRQAGVWVGAVALMAALWWARGGPWARGRGWQALLAFFAAGVGLTLRWGVHPAGLGGRLWLPLGPWFLPPGEGVKAVWAGAAAREAATGRGLSARGWALALGLAGLLVVQGDWGAAGLVLLVALTVHSAESGRLRVWTLTAVLALALTPWLVAHVPRVAQRWTAWLRPETAPQAAGYQVLAAERALQQGGWWGTGMGAGQPQRVPLSATDFVFVAWGEETGWVGAAFVVGLEAAVWLGLGWRACCWLRGWPRRLGLAVAAYGAWLSLWVLAGNVRLVPLSGLPLPWVAHGGAALLALSWLVAVVVTRSPAPSPAPCPRGWQAHLWAWAGGFGLVLLRVAWLMLRA